MQSYKVGSVNVSYAQATTTPQRSAIANRTGSIPDPQADNRTSAIRDWAASIGLNTEEKRFAVAMLGPDAPRDDLRRMRGRDQLYWALRGAQVARAVVPAIHMPYAHDIPGLSKTLSAEQMDAFSSGFAAGRAYDGFYLAVHSKYASLTRTGNNLYNLRMGDDYAVIVDSAKIDRDYELG